MQTTYSSNIPELAEVMVAYAQATRKPMADILEDQANKLCSSDFGDGNIGLAQEAIRIAPDKKELFALPILLNYRIRRRGRPVFTAYQDRTIKRGKNAGKVVRSRAKTQEGVKIKAGEIERRAAARFFNASGWLNPRFLKYVRKQKLKPNGAVIIQLTGSILSVEFINQTRNSQEINLSHGDYVSRALKHRIDDMMVYINRHLDRVSVDFNSKRLTPPK
jgi:hypothetical protein